MVIWRSSEWLWIFSNNLKINLLEINSNFSRSTVKVEIIMFKIKIEFLMHIATKTTVNVTQ